MLGGLTTLKRNLFLSYEATIDPDSVAITSLNDTGGCAALVRTPTLWRPGARTSLPLACSRIRPALNCAGATVPLPLSLTERRTLLDTQNKLPIL